MPSVGMRRTTSVFGVVKGVDGEARVLRSGRRLWPESGASKLRRGVDGDEWPGIVDKKGSGYGHKHASNVKNGCANSNLILQQESGLMDVEACGIETSETVYMETLNAESEKNMDKMFGLVYSRKRKRMEMVNICDLESKKSGPKEKRFGICFSRRQWSRKSKNDDIRDMAVIDGFDNKVGSLQQDFSDGLVLAAVESSYGSSANCRSIYFGNILCSILGYLRRRRVSMSQLFKFLTSDPLGDVYSRHGILCLQDPPPTISSGLCKIFGARQFTPLFSVDFSAVPLCFMHMYSSMLLRYRYLLDAFLQNPMCGHQHGIAGTQREMQPAEISLIDCKGLASAADNFYIKSMLHPSVRSSKLASQTSPYSSCLNFHSIQKRRSSLRSRRARNPSVVSINSAKGSLVSDLIRRRKLGIPFSSVASNKFRGSVLSGFSSSLKEATPTFVSITQDTSPSCCSANILVTDSDRCYREEGASVMLEMSDSGEWVLVVKKDGLVRYGHKAQKVMRPASSNRVTHDVIWAVENGWKLEFLSRQEWMVFKDLYKECYDRNVPLSPMKAIPIPGVREVSCDCDSSLSLFSRPDSYITMTDDEVSRALSKSTAHYDIDSEDEEWLNKFNNEFFGQNKLQDYVSVGSFELLIDALEKAYYCSPDDFSDDETVTKLFLKLGSKEVVEAVYCYWMKKRKQRRSTLIRIFQVQQPRKAFIIPKPALRKRRSFKRQGSQLSRGRQPILLKAMAKDQDALAERNAIIKVESAKVAAKRSLDVAIAVRQRAQILMENADLSTYRAAMALKIFEASQRGKSLDCAAALFFG